MKPSLSPPDRFAQTPFGRLAATMVVFLMFLTPIFTAPLKAQGIPAGVRAPLTYDVSAGFDNYFSLSGSAYLEPGRGLSVNESGLNHVTAPSFEAGTGGWLSLDGAVMTVDEAVAFAGDRSLAVSTTAAEQGVAIETSSGGLAGIVPGSLCSFSIYVKTPTGTADDIWITLDGSASGTTSFGPFSAGSQWQRLTIHGQLDAGDEQLRVAIYPGRDTPTAQLLLDAAQLELRQYATPYFDGSQAGSTWNGAAHDSVSRRQAGKAWIANEDVGLDPSLPFWFTVDVELGFGRDDYFGSYPIGTKDFINWGVPRGDGFGMASNEGVILDYYSINKRLNFYRINSRGQVGYPMPAFKAGDRMRAVCAWDPEEGMKMWVQVAAAPVFNGSLSDAKAKSAAQIGPGSIFSVSDSGAWYGYGEYQSNSWQRNVLARQGRIDEERALAYISDPSAFLQGCGAQPELSLEKSSIYWDSFSDYTARLLSVDYQIGNTGGGAAYQVQVNDSISTNGVLAATSTPMSLGSVPAGMNQNFVFRYQVPAGVSSFRSRLQAEAVENCGERYYYGGVPLP